MKWPVTIISTLLLSVFFSFVFSSSVFAVSDLSITYQGLNSGDYLFPDCDATCQSQYKYLIVEYEPWLSSNSFYVQSQYKIGGSSRSGGFYLSSMVGYGVFDITYSTSQLQFQASGFSSKEVTVTLTENDPAGEPDCPVCPEPEEPEPCPVVPDNPYDQKLDNITLAIYTCGAVILVIYFFYCIYRMIIKTTGGL